MTSRYPHGLLAFQVSGDCTLSLAWQATPGFDIAQTPDNPAIPPMVANGAVYDSTVSSSTIYADSPTAFGLRSPLGTAGGARPADHGAPSSRPTARRSG